MTCRNLMGIFCAAALFSCSNELDKVESPKEPQVVRAGLRGNRPDAKVLNLQQIARPIHNEAFEVPTFPTITDEFYQADDVMLKMDILIVVDNSGSMYEEQANLSTKLSALLDGLDDVDWLINVITTDNPCFKAPLPLNKGTPNLANTFKKEIERGISGDGYEKGIELTTKHLAQIEHTSTTYPYETCTAEKWTRKGANLAVLILSDEDEDPSSTATPEGFHKLLHQLGYVPTKTARVYGIVWRPGSKCETGYGEAFIYSDLVKLTGGIMGDICAEDYTQALLAISHSMRDSLKIEYPLRAVPVLSTFSLTLDGSIYPGRFTIVENRIVLEDPLEKGTTLIAKYKIDEVRVIPLRHNPNIETIEVLVDDKPILSKQYIYDEARRLLLFNSALPEGHQVTVRYRENVPLLTEFPVPKLKDRDQIECYKVDAYIPHIYTPALSTVSFLETLSDGEKLTCLIGVDE